ncbi:MAG: hypothetical protein MJ211_03025 [Bacteroidales bacterium]|nr:hypothetical protein [Bacteroidales bacterium]
MYTQISQYLASQFHLDKNSLNQFLSKSLVMKELNQSNSNLNNQSLDYILSLIKEEYLSYIFDDDRLEELPEGQFVRGK